ARDLHDGAQQRLLALGAMLGTLEAVTGDPGVKEHAWACRAELKEALAQLRALAREVQPALLAQDGLGSALEVVAERLGTRVTLDVTPRRFSREIESTLYSALCETLSYAVERARATRILVRVSEKGGQVVAEIELDGTGLSGGLAKISARLRSLHGSVELVSDFGRGMTIRMALPCEQPKHGTPGS
ncbi:sensor histidine kinase, partial [Actinomadura luteofluorescens]